MYDFGSYDIDIDIEYHKNKFKTILDNSQAKITGLKGLNFFHTLDKNDKMHLHKYMNNLTGICNDWNFEYFHSGEPAGLHTDYDTVPWNDTTDCLTVVGCIIPLEWNCKQPYTVNYNRKSDVPRKMIYRKGEMRYKDTNEIVPYRNKYKWNKEVLKYNPRTCMYAKEYCDLKVDSVYKWDINTVMLFDAARWHSSSWFLSTDDIPDDHTEYKRAIIGFGSIDVHRN